MLMISCEGVLGLLNYSNLNDVEFEYLCQDVMSQALGVKLRRFAAGRDGGIDLTNDAHKKSIVVQVKHYDKSNIAGLISSLKRELPKVEKIKPKEYYICCSKELSAKRIAELYSTFSNYMSSSNNIITLNEIDDYLMLPEYEEVLRKHYKLWLTSTNILHNIFSNDIFVDCESLLSNIEDDKNFFVQTAAYDEAISCLQKNKTLFLTGDPGVGKTVTSKMIVLHYAALGYTVRFTTDGADLASLKKSLSQNRENKEIILLDDCFGQAYFNMKETQGNELLALIRYVNLSENKRLLLNSRVTIFREAQSRTPELIKSFENREYKVHILDMSAMSLVEKAKIFYNHLYFNKIDDAYFAAIKKNKNYRAIIEHTNYNPRIIEFVSNPNRYGDTKPDEYFDFVVAQLDNPEKVWHDEYERKLSKTDRVLLTTLFSLTNTSVSLALVEKCFNNRIQNMPDIDLTVNQFQNSLLRLQEAFVTIIDKKGNRELSMVNPSVNDYIESRINKTKSEKDVLISSATAVLQWRKLLSVDEYNEKLAATFADGSIENCDFESDKAKSAFIAYYVLRNQIMDIRYKQYIYSFFAAAEPFPDYTLGPLSLIYPLEYAAELPVCTFYELNSYFSNCDLLDDILRSFTLGDFVEAVKHCYAIVGNNIPIAQHLKLLVEEEISLYSSDIDAREYDVDIHEIVTSSARPVYYGDDFESDIDTDEAASQIEKAVEIAVKKEVDELVQSLPLELSPSPEFIDELYISVSGANDMVKSYLMSDYDDDERRISPSSDNYFEIDLIFDR